MSFSFTLRALFFCSLILLLLNTACKKAAPVSVITGQVTGCEECEITLNFQDFAQATETEKKYTTVKNGTFYLQDTLEKEGWYTLKLKPKSGEEIKSVLYLPADTVKILINPEGAPGGKIYRYAHLKSDLRYAKVTSTSPVQADANYYLMLKDSMEMEFRNAYNLQKTIFGNFIENGTKAQVDKQADIVRKFDLRRTRFLSKAGSIFVQQRPQSEATFFAMYDSRDDRAAAVKFRQYFNTLPLERQESYYGKILNVRIGKWEQRNKNVKRFLGREITFLAGLTPEGKKLDAAKIFKQNKYTLIDFWSSWCDSCHLKIPQYQKLYQNYHPKGFEIIAVSLDDDQKEWTDAIKKHNYPAQHLSELEGGKGSDIIRFRLHGIPSNVLINGQGKIEAFDITPEKLKSKLEKTL